MKLVDSHRGMIPFMREGLEILEERETEPSVLQAPGQTRFPKKNLVTVERQS